MPALRTRDTQSRSLEVTTDAPQPPVLNIVSPTPRAFTFPISHNLSVPDSPYSSPSQSPFEPDLRSLPSVSQCTTPPLQPASYTRTLTPDSSFRSASPASMHRRRKSSCSSDIIERRPKKGDEDYIKRPENAFILFRRKCCEERHAAMEEADGPTKKQRQADLSKTISQQWKGLSPEDRKYWEDLAKEKKKEHEQMYPNYVYRPQRAKDRDGRSKSRKTTKGLPEHETDSEGVSFVVPMAAPRHHGRSASAPTPPPYTIQVPTVYMTPSCPTSPSLLPMISRRSSHAGNPEDAMSNFDFIPNNNYLSPAYGQAGSMDSNLNQSEFLRSMWDIPSQPSAQRQGLQPLTLAANESGLLPAHQIISPSSAVISPSSSIASSIADALTSPESSPYTPSTGHNHNFILPPGMPALPRATTTSSSRCRCRTTLHPTTGRTRTFGTTPTVCWATISS
ncbi:hypothetical protein BDQ17DRAFT_634751 [Cyathus striatus]|nr:hypothetical protein BDQ17DRAFT_634751 [Cyathus striatus]